MAARVHIQAFRDNLRSNAKSYIPFMRNAAETVCYRAKIKMLQEFDNHPVTKEIKAGPSVKDKGLIGKPNLFAFIGFDKNSDPINNLRNVLDQLTYMSDTQPVISFLADSIIYGYGLHIPTATELRDNAPLPFNSNRSWPEALENGLWGLSHYLFGLLLSPPKEFPQSRSGPGLESKYQIRATEAPRIVYLSEIIDHFKTNAYVQ